MDRQTIDLAVADAPLWFGGAAIGTLACVISLALVGGCGRFSGKEPPAAPPPAPKTAMPAQAHPQLVPGGLRVGESEGQIPSLCPESGAAMPSAGWSMPQVAHPHSVRWVRA